MLKLAVITGSTRPGRKSRAVADWVLHQARQHGELDADMVDIADFRLPLLDEPVPPSMNQYSQPHTLAWAARIAPFDAFIFVTPEYNHGIPGALKNALDYLYKEWNDKVAGVVAYGSAGGVRAVEHLRTVLSELQVAHVRAQVMLSLREDFVHHTDFHPAPHQLQALDKMLEQVQAWGEALKRLRNTPAKSLGS